VAGNKPKAVTAADIAPYVNQPGSAPDHAVAASPSPRSQGMETSAHAPTTASNPASHIQGRRD